jgi:hypothetical protein
MAPPPPHPMQPVVLAEDNVIRFRPNRLVQWMLAQGERGERFDINRIVAESQRRGYEPDEIEQFWQLVGYSVSGFGGLSDVRPETAEAADELAAPLVEQWRAAGGSR